MASRDILLAVLTNAVALRQLIAASSHQRNAQGQATPGGKHMAETRKPNILFIMGDDIGWLISVAITTA